MARERQSPEVAPVPQENLERFSPNALHEVSGLYEFRTVLAENKQRQLLTIDTGSIGLSGPFRNGRLSEAEYQHAVARTEALRGVVYSFIHSRFNTLGTEEGSIDGLIKKGQALGVDSTQLLGLDSLRGAFRDRERVRMQQRAEALTQMVADTGRELWVVAQQGNDDARVARFVGMALTGENKDMKLEPIVLDKAEEQRGLLPAGYMLTPFPLHIIVNRADH